jgi:hypothetical protein
MKKLTNKNLLLKSLIVVISLILISSKVSAIGIEVISFASYVDETEVKIQIEINLTLPYTVYENDSEIVNGTLFAYTLTNITTARNLTPDVVIQHSLFINRSTEEYTAHTWLNFSYSNYPEIHEFGMIESLPLFIIVSGMAAIIIINRRKK